ncbi:MAG: hypothetical protein ACMUIU_01835 [bacterium]
MTDSNNESLESKTMTIVEACIPPLKAGEYTVKVEQTIKKGEDDKEIFGSKDGATFSKEQSFQVSAPRFSLDSFDIYSVYPPAGSVGRFSESFPHIVLSRRTLPWERSLNGSINNGKTIPWMALLLLDEDDLRLDNNKQELRELKSISLKEIEQFKSKLNKWEKEEDICNTIEIPLDLFKAIVPSMEDLPYLAHARKVSTGDMESDGIKDEGWFSVIIGNRLPTPNKENRVYLVSLEGLEDFIQKKTEEDQNAGPPKNIRLVVLTSWSFVDKTEGKGFRDLVNSLAPAPFKIEYPNIEKEITTALDFGYAPLNHSTRQGYKTMSWYRGPFTPHFLPTDPNNAVYSHTDEALRYDPNMGLFDVSYAAAWQLGRLLGIKNQHFARSLYTFITRRVQKAANELAWKNIQERFGSQENGSMEKLVHEFLKGVENQPLNGTLLDDGISHTTKQENDITNYSENLKDELKNGIDRDEIPQEIREWLGRLFVLQGVPINYLIPHPCILKDESIRFFYVDTCWIGALMDGALSIGRSSESRLFLDKAMAGNFFEFVLDDYKVCLNNQTEQNTIVLITGFLLRSALVSGWRGLEVVAEDGDEKKLRALRMERIARDTMLCIYNGQVKKVVIAQPPHTLHFGVTENENEFKKIIDNNKSEEIKVPMRETPRVVSIKQLAENLGFAENRAEFAKTMIDKPVKCTIDVIKNDDR